MPITLPKTSWPPQWRRHAERAAATPFTRLVRHFLGRLVRGDSTNEFEIGAGVLLGLLAAPGAFQSLLLLDKYSTFLYWLRGHPHSDLYVASAPDKYLFISLAMAITGIVTVLKWDRILPDNQDYLNLAPLPIRPRTILLANVAAIGIAVMVFAIDVNAISAVLFPLFVTAAAGAGFAAYVHFVAIQAFCLLLASLFTFFAVFALFGMLTVVLPREIFRAWSAWLRGAVLLAFIMLLSSGFAGPSAMHRLAQMGWVPSIWFLGLYQSLQNRATPDLARFAHRAIRGTEAALFAMVLSYALSYRSRFAAVLEAGRAPSRQRFSAAAVALLDLFAWRTSGFHRAAYRFLVRALLRNETHRLCLGVSLGLGWLLAIERESLYEGGLIAAYLLILGMRLAFALPAAVPANWPFRLVLDAGATETHALARHIMLSFLVPCVLLPELILTARHGGVLTAILHTLYILAVSLCLIEILLAGYRKIPFTTPAPGFRDNLPVLCLFQFLGFEIFTSWAASLERWMLDAPARLLLLPAVMAAAWYWNQNRLKEARAAGELESGLSFDSLPTPAFERLDLSDVD